MKIPLCLCSLILSLPALAGDPPLKTEPTHGEDRQKKYPNLVPTEYYVVRYIKVPATNRYPEKTLRFEVPVFREKQGDKQPIVVQAPPK